MAPLAKTYPKEQQKMSQLPGFYLHLPAEMKEELKLGTGGQTAGPLLGA